MRKLRQMNRLLQTPVPIPTEAPSPTLMPAMLEKIDAYWRAANYLSVGQIYLHDNPLL